MLVVAHQLGQSGTESKKELMIFFPPGADRDSARRRRDGVNGLDEQRDVNVTRRFQPHSEH